MQCYITYLDNVQNGVTHCFTLGFTYLLKQQWVQQICLFIKNCPTYEMYFSSQIFMNLYFVCH